MKIAGIIAEYNPFHNGHLYQIQETQKQIKCDALIAVMSGNFSQRGEATVTDKFTRAKMALLNGIDLVIELPVPFATASAERFATGAVRILDQSRIVSLLSFGSECGSIDDLSLIAQTLVQNESKLYSTISHYLKKGISFPKAREHYIIQSLQHLTTHDLSSILQNPNNILGIEYIKALLNYHSFITPFTLKRVGAQYHEETLITPIASASAIRKALYSHTPYTSHMPYSAASLLNHIPLPSMENISSFLHYKFIFSKPEDLYATWDVPHDLIHKFIKLSSSYPTYHAYVTKATSKTYTRSTVSRSLLRLLLGIQDKDMTPLNVPYIRILGCKKEKSWLLKELSSKSNLPIITNLNKQYATLTDIQKKWIQYELTATKLYAYATQTPQLAMQDFTQPFIML